MNIAVSTKNLRFLEAFSSETRIKIIEQLNERPMNIKELASSLGISSAIVTKHVQKLEEAGIIGFQSVAGKRGTQKICSISMEQATLQFKTKKQHANTYSASIPVGQYTAFQVKPTCGLVSHEKRIGLVDDPRYFADPEHVKACHIWFGSGWVTYRIPNYVLHSQQVRRLEITLEICSEAPEYNENWPSDIEFSLNDISLGTWTCPGDFGSRRGTYTPDWWKNGTQHGLLKTITVHEEGTDLDGVKLSPVTLSELDITQGKELFLRIESPETAENCGGVSLFGKNFGNYNQDIKVEMTYV